MAAYRSERGPEGKYVWELLNQALRLGDHLLISGIGLGKFVSDTQDEGDGRTVMHAESAGIQYVRLPGDQVLRDGQGLGVLRLRIKRPTARVEQVREVA